MSNIISWCVLCIGFIHLIAVVYHTKKKTEFGYFRYLLLFVPYLALTSANITLSLKTNIIYLIILCMLLFCKILIIVGQTMSWSKSENPESIRFKPMDVGWSVGLLALNILAIII